MSKVTITTPFLSVSETADMLGVSSLRVEHLSELLSSGPAIKGAPKKSIAGTVRKRTKKAPKVAKKSR